MKKYIKPITQVMSISSHLLLIESAKGLDGVTTSKEGFAGGKVDSRRHSFWDDDED